MNPPDLEGFVAVRPDLLAAAAETYFSSPGVDALLFMWLLQPDAAVWSDRVFEGLSKVAQTQRKPFVISSSDNGDIADWARELPSRGIAVGRGIRGTLRGLKAMGEFVRASSRPRDTPTPSRPIKARPSAELVSSGVGKILSFRATMTLLEEFGIPTAPFVIVGATSDSSRSGLPGPLCRKAGECSSSDR